MIPRRRCFSEKVLVVSGYLDREPLPIAYR
jgi:hypothetical protein